MHYFWPRPHDSPPPKLLFTVSALLGYRSPYQQGKSIQQIASSNIQYAMNNLNFLPNSAHKSLSLEVFGNFDYPLDLYCSITYGDASQIYIEFPCKSLLANLFMHIRHTIMVQKKSYLTLKDGNIWGSENVAQ
jgi:hypothetical protein